MASCGMRKVSGERGGGAWERRIGWAKEGVLAPDSEFRWIGWAVGTDSILAWEEVLALDMDGRDEGGMGRKEGRGAKG